MKHLESKEQMAVVSWSRFAKIPGTNQSINDYLICIPNEGRRHPRHGQKLKKLGMKAGVSDLFLAYPVFPCHGLWIEMKKRFKDYPSDSAAKGAVTKPQREWLYRMEEADYMVTVAYGAEDAISRIKIYLGYK